MSAVRQRDGGERNLYAVLGVARDASPDAIRASYHNFSIEFHPDRQQGEEQRATARVAFEEISTAYSVLSDPNLRHAYDAFGMEGVETMRDTETYQLVASDPTRRVDLLRRVHRRRMGRAVDAAEGRSTKITLELDAAAGARAAAREARASDPPFFGLALGAARVLRRRGPQRLLPMTAATFEVEAEVASGETRDFSWEVTGIGTAEVTLDEPDDSGSEDGAWLVNDMLSGLLGPRGGPALEEDAPDDDDDDDEARPDELDDEDMPWGLELVDDDDAEGADSLVDLDVDADATDDDDDDDDDDDANAHPRGHIGDDTGLGVSGTVVWLKRRTRATAKARVIGPAPGVEVSVTQHVAGTQFVVAESYQATRDLGGGFSSMLGGSASVSTRGRVSLRGMAELARQTGSRARESVTLVSMPESPLPHVLLSARRIVEGWLLSASGQVGLVPIRVRAPSWIAAVTGVHPILAEVKLGVGTTRPDARVRGVTIKLRGKSLVLEPKFAVGSTTVALPILLSKASSLTEAVSFAAASTLAGWLVDRLRGRRARRNRFAELRASLVQAYDDLLESVERGFAQQRMMARRAARVRARESERGGLVVLSATFGVEGAQGVDASVLRPTDAAAAAARIREAAQAAEASSDVLGLRHRAELVVDVAVPLQHAVSNGALFIAGGVMDVLGSVQSIEEPAAVVAEMERAALGATEEVKCTLRVRYAFGEDVYEIETDGAQDIALPFAGATRLGRVSLVE